MKKPRLIERKLGRERAFGLAYKEDGVIEIDPRQKPKSYLDTLIHEKLHIMFPDWSENKVRKATKELRDFLWENSYRKVSL